MSAQHIVAEPAHRRLHIEGVKALSFDWDGEALLVATPTDSSTSPSTTKTI
jgi:hypothetical protein